MKLDFFARIYLAITDFRLYPFVVQREKFINALAYFVCFILLFSAILSAGVTSRAMNWLNNFTCIYNEKVDDFEVKNGELIVAQNMDFEYEKVRIYANGDLNFGELNENVFKDSENIVTVLALKDSISVGNENVGFVITKYKDVNLDINKAETYESLRFALDSWIFKLSLAIIIFCGVFVAYLITKFLNVVGITLMLLFLGYVFGTKYKFKDWTTHSADGSPVTLEEKEVKEVEELFNALFDELEKSIKQAKQSADILDRIIKDMEESNSRPTAKKVDISDDEKLLNFLRKISE